MRRDFLTQPDARAKCQNLSGDLATIEDQDEHELVTRNVFFLANYYFYYFKLLGLVNQPTFLGHNTSAAGFTAWEAGEPRAGGGECAMVYQRNRGWRAHPCNAYSNYLCEKGTREGYVEEEEAGKKQRRWTDSFL